MGDLDRDWERKEKANPKTFRREERGYLQLLTVYNGESYKTMEQSLQNPKGKQIWTYSSITHQISILQVWDFMFKFAWRGRKSGTICNFVLYIPSLCKLVS